MSSRRATKCKRFLSMMQAAGCGLYKAAGALLKALPTFGLLWLLTPAWAQISPGPLSRAHQSLTGATNCTACHKFGSAATLKCVACHAEIGTRSPRTRDSTPPTTFRQDRARSAPVATPNITVRIFRSSSGTASLLITNLPVTFSKANMPAWPALAAIAPTTSPPQRARRSRSKTCRAAFWAFRRLASPATRIRTRATWSELYPVPQLHRLEDLSGRAVRSLQTRYPLTGLHVQVKCEKCHTPGADGKPRYTGIPFAKCSDCHADTHHGSFPQGCESCHSTESWKRISLAAVERNFDHSKTKYPLQGKHATVDCALCHAGGDFKKPVAFAKCMDCHKLDPHNGQFAKRPGGASARLPHCGGFKPSTYTARTSRQFGLSARRETFQPSNAPSVISPKAKTRSSRLSFALHRLPQR